MFCLIQPHPVRHRPLGLFHNCPCQPRPSRPSTFPPFMCHHAHLRHRSRPLRIAAAAVAVAVFIVLVSKSDPARPAPHFVVISFSFLPSDCLRACCSPVFQANRRRGISFLSLTRGAAFLKFLACFLALPGVQARCEGAGKTRQALAEAPADTIPASGSDLLVRTA